MQEINMKKNYLLLALAMLILPFTASAADEPIFSKMCEAYDCTIGSGLGLVMATTAIFFLGVGAFFGKVNWGLIIVAIIGIVVIFGAFQIALMIVGEDNAGDYDTCNDGECEPMTIEAN